MRAIIFSILVIMFTLSACSDSTPTVEAPSDESLKKLGYVRIDGIPEDITENATHKRVDGTNIWGPKSKPIRLGRQ